MSLKKKIVVGGVYVAIVNVVAQFSAVGVNVIFAWLLSPDDFGLIALVTTYTGLVTLITNIGFGSAIINEQKATQEQLSSIYFLNFVLGIFSYIIVYLLAPFAADFYEEGRLVQIVYFSSLSVLIFPFYITHYKIKERDLELKLLSKINMTSILVGVLLGVGSAFIGMGVYALVIQSLSGGITRLIMTLYHSDWNPSKQFNIKSVYQMIWYALKFKLSKIALYFERNIDYLILGKLYSSAVLGYYSFAYLIMYTPIKRVSYLFSDILFPSFSIYKDNKEKIILGYFKSIELIAIVTFPTMAILGFNSQLIISFMYGNKWDEAIPIVQILCFAGAIQSISQVGDIIFAAIGKPEVITYITTIRALLTAAAIILGGLQSILIVAYYLVIVKILSFSLLLIVLYYFIPFSIMSLLKYLSGPLITLIVLFVIQYAFIRFELEFAGILKLILMVVTASLIFLSLHLSTATELYRLFRSKT
ncbi:MAG: lipopolysaccharide biosynthesis protein [Bacteroidetes bacterium]|nr:lipopolysaccharide biosynthesis protein [Bacteroidota bacterium]